MRAKNSVSDSLLSFNLTYSSGMLDEPRNDAIDHIVKLALTHSDKRGVSEREIVQILENTRELPPLRRKIVSQSLKRLSGKKHVKLAQGLYMLSEGERNRILLMARERQDRLQKCGNELLKRVEVSLPKLSEAQRESVGEFFRATIFELLESFTYRCAELICYPSKKERLMNSNDARIIMGKNARTLGLGEEKLYRVLEKEFIHMLTKSLNSDLDAIVFELSQNYYILELIGINPHTPCLSNTVFKGYVVYLDSNIIINAILKNKLSYAYFEELISLVKGLGIQLKVAKITLDEIRGVADYHKSICYKEGEIYEEIPERYEERVDDDFYIAYIENKRLSPTYKLDDLFEPFDTLEETITGFGIDVDSSDVHQELLKDEGPLKGIGQTVYDVALETKHKHKTQASRRHDAFIYLLIRHLRNKENPKTIHLTLDKTLTIVAEKLQKGSTAQPYCFTLDVWLQTLSPFISQKTESDCARIFVQSFSSNLFVFGEMFSVEAFYLLKSIDVKIDKYSPEVQEEILTLIENEFERGQILNPKTQSKARFRIESFLARVELEAQEMHEKEKELILSEGEIRELVRDEYKQEMDGLKKELKGLRRANLLKTIREWRRRKILRDNIIHWGVAGTIWAATLIAFLLPYFEGGQLAKGWLKFGILAFGALGGLFAVLSGKIVKLLKLRGKLWKVGLEIFGVVSGIASIIDIILRIFGK